MAVNYYAGVPGAAIDVQSEEDLAEALDVIHTQVMDSLGEEHPALRDLERAMEAFHAGPKSPPKGPGVPVDLEAAAIHADELGFRGMGQAETAMRGLIGEVMRLRGENEELRGQVAHLAMGLNG